MSKKLPKFEMPRQDEAGDPVARKRSPSEQAYRGILKAIYEGRFVPGQRLIAPDLMEELGVGRGTIREVLNRLAASGIIDLVQNRGAQVRRMTRKEVLELLDIVELMLGLAARGAASNIGQGEARDELLAYDRRLRSVTADATLPSFVEAREAYYRAIVRLSRNEELRRLFPGAQVHIMRLQLRPFQQAGDSANLEDFTNLTKAILAGDPTKAETEGRRHVILTRDRVRDLPEAAFRK